MEQPAGRRIGRSAGAAPGPPSASGPTRLTRSGRRWRGTGRRGCRRRCGRATPAGVDSMQPPSSTDHSSGGSDPRVGHVVGVQDAVAVALDQHVVDDDRRLPRRAGQAGTPTARRRSPCPSPARSRRRRARSTTPVVQRRRGPEPAGPVVVVVRPTTRAGRPGWRGSSFNSWPTSVARALTPLVLAGDVEEALLVDDDRWRRCRRRSRTGTPASASPGLAADVPALHEAAGVGEVDDVVVRWRRSSRSTRRGRRCRRAARRPSPGVLNTSCGSTCTSPSAP